MRVLVVGLLIQALILGTAFCTIAASDINGTITNLRDGAVKVSFPTPTAVGPQTGDQVEFSTEMQGFTVRAGQGEVTEAGADFAWVKVTKGHPKPSYQALIHATGAPVSTKQVSAQPAEASADHGWGENAQPQNNNQNQLLAPIIAANQACDFQGAYQLAQQAQQQAPNNTWLQQNLPTLQTLAQRSLNYQQSLNSALRSLESNQINASIDYLKQAMQNASVQCHQDKQVRSLLEVAKQMAQSERELAIAEARQKVNQSAQDSRRYRQEIEQKQAQREAIGNLLTGNLLGLLGAVNSSSTPEFSETQQISAQEMVNNMAQQTEQNNSEILNKWRASQGLKTVPSTKNSNSGW